MGVPITKREITSYLTALEFEPRWAGNQLIVSVPSFRARDIKEEEDVLEEIARIYGYHNLPSKLMDGAIPDRPVNPEFKFEENVKNYLSGWGGVEVYTLSLVPKSFTDSKSLKLKNPLGIDTEYLRTSLMPSLASAAIQNAKIFDSFHLFEVANIYIPRSNNLPEEKMTIAGIFSGYKYRDAKGIIEALLEKLHVYGQFVTQDINGFSAGHSANIIVRGEVVGAFGVLDNSDFIYYEFDSERLRKLCPEVISYKGIPKYPPQIEDLTFVLPEKTKVGEVSGAILSTNRLVDNVELKDIYKDSYTFRIWYQHSNKTLTDKEVEGLRNKILQKVKERFGGNIKSN